MHVKINNIDFEINTIFNEILWRKELRREREKRGEKREERMVYEHVCVLGCEYFRQSITVEILCTHPRRLLLDQIRRNECAPNCFWDNGITCTNTLHVQNHQPHIYQTMWQMHFRLIAAKTFISRFELIFYNVTKLERSVISLKYTGSLATTL